MEDTAFLMGMMFGFGVLISLSLAVYRDYMSRGGSELSATLWAFGTFSLSFVVLPLYFIFRALAPPTKKD